MARPPKAVAAVAFALAFALMAVIAGTGAAADNPGGSGSFGTIAVKAGAWFPQGDIDAFDTGFAGEVALGYRATRTIGVELGVGYLQSEADGSVSVPGLGVVRQTEELEVVPFTLTLKAYVPIGDFAPYGEVGIGLYRAEAEISIPGGAASDRDYIGGVHLGVGADFAVSRRIFLGVAGRYFRTEEADFHVAIGGVPFRAQTSLEAFVATAAVGYRFDIRDGF